MDIFALCARISYALLIKTRSPLFVLPKMNFPTQRTYVISRQIKYFRSKSEQYSPRGIHIDSSPRGARELAYRVEKSTPLNSNSPHVGRRVYACALYTHIYLDFINIEAPTPGDRFHRVPILFDSNPRHTTRRREKFPPE